jgi:hypothetical protein
MTDRAAPKGKKKPAKDLNDGPERRPKPKVVSISPGIGHNQPHTGEVNPEAVKRLEELMALQEQKKAIAKAERDVRNSLKTEFGILASSVAREVALRKLDADVRVQVETNHEDFKKMLGYQPSLDFVGGVATEASQKAQPKEAELDERSTEPQRGPKPPAADGKGFEVQDEDEGGDDDQGGVITREG